MSLYTFVQGGLAARLPLRRGDGETPVAPEPVDAARTAPARLPELRLPPVRLSARLGRVPRMSSMRALETGLALSAIATALLIGQAH